MTIQYCFVLFLPKIISFHIFQSPPQCCTAISNIRFHNPLDSADSDWPSLVFTPGHNIRALSAFLKEQGANNMQWAPLLGLSLLLNSLFYHCGRLRRVLPARSFVIGLKVLLLTLHRAKQRAWGPSTEFLVCQSCLPYHPLHGPIQRDQSVIEMNLYMNIKKRKRWIAHFMPSTAGPSQRCQAHFAGRTYNTIKSCNMAKVSVRIHQHEHKQTSQAGEGLSHSSIPTMWNVTKHSKKLQTPLLCQKCQCVWKWLNFIILGVLDQEVFMMPWPGAAVFRSDLHHPLCAAAPWQFPYAAKKCIPAFEGVYLRCAILLTWLEV